MITIRKSSERGHANHGWLDSHHTFSFAGYQDPNHMGFRKLRVINEDRVRGGEGFGTHPHNDMEIISYVVDGKLSHRDSMGSVGELKPGDVQVMSAGTGITHSEFNGDPEKTVHFLQIWIIPNGRGHKPRYADKTFADKKDRLQAIASNDGRDGSLPIHQDAVVYATVLSRPMEYGLKEGRHAWVQIVRGDIELNGKKLTAGDGAALSDERVLQITPDGEAELLLFDLG